MRCDRQVDAEGGAAARLAVHLDPAAGGPPRSRSRSRGPARCPAPAAWWCRTARRSWSAPRAECPMPVSSTSTTTSSAARRAPRRCAPSSWPPCSIASTALSISAMSTWMSCSALPTVSGSVGRELAHHREPLEALVVLEQEQGLLHQRVQRQPAPCSVAFGRLKSSSPSTIRVQRSTSLSMISRYSVTCAAPVACRRRAGPRSPRRRR